MSNSSLENKKKESLSSVFSVRITNSQKELLNKNPWVKREIEYYIRTLLDGFSI